MKQYFLPPYTAMQLKLFAAVCMLLDHIGATLVFTYVGINVNNMDAKTYCIVSVVYYALRIVGRVAFPIFLLFIVEGFIKTSDRRRYFTRVAVFALVSEPAFMLAAGFYRRNAGFALFLVLCMLKVLEYIRLGRPEGRERVIFPAFTVMVTTFIAAVTRCDYGLTAPVLAAFIYYVCDPEFGFCIMPGLYSGERGKLNKYFFYVFYPVHLLILGAIKHYMRMTV